MVGNITYVYLFVSSGDNGVGVGCYSKDVSTCKAIERSDILIARTFLYFP